MILISIVVLRLLYVGSSALYSCLIFKACGISGKVGLSFRNVAFEYMMSEPWSSCISRSQENSALQSQVSLCSPNGRGFFPLKDDSLLCCGWSLVMLFWQLYFIIHQKSHLIFFIFIWEKPGGTQVEKDDCYLQIDWGRKDLKHSEKKKVYYKGKSEFNSQQV